MSSNGTFSADGHHHTDADPSPSPFYSSIHESNLAHQQYKAKQHQVGGRGQWVWLDWCWGKGL